MDRIKAWAQCNVLGIGGDGTTEDFKSKRGVVVYGPPGCGKMHALKMVLPAFNLRCFDVLSRTGEAMEEKDQHIVSAAIDFLRQRPAGQNTSRTVLVLRGCDRADIAYINKFCLDIQEANMHFAMTFENISQSEREALSPHCVFVSLDYMTQDQCRKIVRQWIDETQKEKVPPQTEAMVAYVSRGYYPVLGLEYRFDIGTRVFKDEIVHAGPASFSVLRAHQNPHNQNKDASAAESIARGRVPNFEPRDLGRVKDILFTNYLSLSDMTLDKALQVSELLSHGDVYDVPFAESMASLFREGQKMQFCTGDFSVPSWILESRPSSKSVKDKNKEEAIQWAKLAVQSTSPESRARAVEVANNYDLWSLRRESHILKQAAAQWKAQRNAAVADGFRMAFTVAGLSDFDSLSYLMHTHAGLPIKYQPRSDAVEPQTDNNNNYNNTNKGTGVTDYSANNLFKTKEKPTSATGPPPKKMKNSQITSFFRK